MWLRQHRLTHRPLFASLSNELVPLLMLAIVHPLVHIWAACPQLMPKVPETPVPIAPGSAVTFRKAPLAAGPVDVWLLTTHIG